MGIRYMEWLDNYRIVAVLMLAMISISCASSRSSLEVSVTKSEVRQSSALWILDTCPSELISLTEENAALLLAPLASLAADFSFKLISSYVEERKKALTGQFTAAGYIGKTGLPHAGCIVIGRGLLGARTWPDQSDKSFAGIDTKILKQLGFAANPAFYLELKIDSAQENGNIKLTPQLLAYGASSAERTGKNGSKNITLAIGMSQSALESPLDLDADSTIKKFSFKFGALQIGRYYELDTLKGTEALAPTDGSLTGRLSLFAIVTESENPGIAETALYDAFQNNSEKIKEALNSFFSDLLRVETETDGSNNDA